VAREGNHLGRPAPGNIIRAAVLIPGEGGGEEGEERKRKGEGQRKGERRGGEDDDGPN